MRHWGRKKNLSLFRTRADSAYPVHLFYVIEQQIEREQFPPELAEKYLEFLKGYLIPKYIEFIGKEIQTAYLESYSEYGQNIFDRYVTYADFWIQDQEYRDPETGQLFDRASLNGELEKIEKGNAEERETGYRSMEEIREGSNGGGGEGGWRRSCRVRRGLSEVYK